MSDRVVTSNPSLVEVSLINPALRAQYVQDFINAEIRESMKLTISEYEQLKPFFQFFPELTKLVVPTASPSINVNGVNYQLARDGSHVLHKVFDHFSRRLLHSELNKFYSCGNKVGACMTIMANVHEIEFLLNLWSANAAAGKRAPTEIVYGVYEGGWDRIRADFITECGIANLGGEMQDAIQTIQDQFQLFGVAPAPVLKQFVVQGAQYNIYFHWIDLKIPRPLFYLQGGMIQIDLFLGHHVAYYLDMRTMGEWLQTINSGRSATALNLMLLPPQLVRYMANAENAPSCALDDTENAYSISRVKTASGDELHFAPRGNTTNIASHGYVCKRSDWISWTHAALPMDKLNLEKIWHADEIAAKVKKCKYAVASEFACYDSRFPLYVVKTVVTSSVRLVTGNLFFRGDLWVVPNMMELAKPARYATPMNMLVATSVLIPENLLSLLRSVALKIENGRVDFNALVEQARVALTTRIAIFSVVGAAAADSQMALAKLFTIQEREVLVNYIAVMSYRSHMRTFDVVRKSRNPAYWSTKCRRGWRMIMNKFSPYDLFWSVFDAQHVWSTEALKQRLTSSVRDLTSIDSGAFPLPMSYLEIVADSSFVAVQHRAMRHVPGFGRRLQGIANQRYPAAAARGAFDRLFGEWVTMSTRTLWKLLTAFPRNEIQGILLFVDGTHDDYFDARCALALNQFKTFDWFLDEYALKPLLLAPSGDVYVHFEKVYADRLPSVDLDTLLASVGWTASFNTVSEAERLEKVFQAVWRIDEHMITFLERNGKWTACKVKLSWRVDLVKDCAVHFLKDIFEVPLASNFTPKYLEVLIANNLQYGPHPESKFIYVEVNGVVKHTRAGAGVAVSLTDKHIKWDFTILPQLECAIQPFERMHPREETSYNRSWLQSDSDFSNRKQKMTLEMKMKSLYASLPTVDFVVCLGCSPGTQLLAQAATMPEKHFIGVDVKPHLKGKIPDNFTLIVSTVEELDVKWLPPPEVTCVISDGVLPFDYAKFVDRYPAWCYDFPIQQACDCQLTALYVLTTEQFSSHELRAFVCRGSTREVSSDTLRTLSNASAHWPHSIFDYADEPVVVDVADCDFDFDDIEHPVIDLFVEDFVHKEEEFIEDVEEPLVCFGELPAHMEEVVAEVEQRGRIVRPFASQMEQAPLPRPFDLGGQAQSESEPETTSEVSSEETVYAELKVADDVMGAVCEFFTARGAEVLEGRTDASNLVNSVLVNEAFLKWYAKHKTNKLFTDPENMLLEAAAERLAKPLGAYNHATQLCVIHGPPGCGKTSLLERQEELGLRGVLVVTPTRELKEGIITKYNMKGCVETPENALGMQLHANLLIIDEALQLGLAKAALIISVLKPKNVLLFCDIFQGTSFDGEGAQQADVCDAIAVLTQIKCLNMDFTYRLDNTATYLYNQCRKHVEHEWKRECVTRNEEAAAPTWEFVTCQMSVQQYKAQYWRGQLVLATSRQWVDFLNGEKYKEQTIAFTATTAQGMNITPQRVGKFKGIHILICDNFHLIPNVRGLHADPSFSAALAVIFTRVSAVVAVRCPITVYICGASASQALSAYFTLPLQVQPIEAQPSTSQQRLNGRNEVIMSIGGKVGTKVGNYNYQVVKTHGETQRIHHVTVKDPIIERPVDPTPQFSQAALRPVKRAHFEKVLLTRQVLAEIAIAFTTEMRGTLDILLRRGFGVEQEIVKVIRTSGGPNPSFKIEAVSDVLKDTHRNKPVLTLLPDYVPAIAAEQSPSDFTFAMVGFIKRAKKSMNKQIAFQQSDVENVAKIMAQKLLERNNIREKCAQVALIASGFEQQLHHTIMSAVKTDFENGEETLKDRLRVIDPEGIIANHTDYVRFALAKFQIKTGKDKIDGGQGVFSHDQCRTKLPEDRSVIYRNFMHAFLYVFSDYFICPAIEGGTIEMAATEFFKRYSPELSILQQDISQKDSSYSIWEKVMLLEVSKAMGFEEKVVLDMFATIENTTVVNCDTIGMKFKTAGQLTSGQVFTLSLNTITTALRAICGEMFVVDQQLGVVEDDQFVFAMAVGDDISVLTKRDLPATTEVKSFLCRSEHFWAGLSMEAKTSVVERGYAFTEFCHHLCIPGATMIKPKRLLNKMLSKYFPLDKCNSLEQLNQLTTRKKNMLKLIRAWLDSMKTHTDAWYICDWSLLPPSALTEFNSEYMKVAASISRLSAEDALRLMSARTLHNFDAQALEIVAGLARVQ